MQERQTRNCSFLPTAADERNRSFNPNANRLRRCHVILLQSSLHPQPAAPFTNAPYFRVYDQYCPPTGQLLVAENSPGLSLFNIPVKRSATRTPLTPVDALTPLATKSKTHHSLNVPRCQFNRSLLLAHSSRLEVISIAPCRHTCQFFCTPIRHPANSPHVHTQPTVESETTVADPPNLLTAS